MLFSGVAAVDISLVLKTSVVVVFLRRSFLCLLNGEVAGRRTSLEAPRTGHLGKRGQGGRSYIYLIRYALLEHNVCIQDLYFEVCCSCICNFHVHRTMDMFVVLPAIFSMCHSLSND